MAKDNRTKYTGYILKPLGSIPKNMTVKLFIDTENSCVEVTCKKLSESIPFERITEFKMEPEITEEEKNYGYGSAVTITQTDANIVRIVGNSLKNVKKKIKWIGYFSFKDENGEVITYDIPEKSGLGYNTSRVKSYDANRFETELKEILENRD
ncbi:MAG: hypothetical protein K6E13_10095 [Lachnospiraceae bacterium]|nr:hypothetical protein [Lachnospiraceae bacterium]